MFSQFKWTLKSFRRSPASSSSIDGHHAFIPRIKISFIGLENCSPLFCFASSRWILYGFDQFSEKFSSAVYFLQNRITRYHFSTCIPCFVQFQCLSYPLRFSVLLRLFAFVYIFRSFLRGGKEIDFVSFREFFAIVYSMLCECYVVFTWILYCK